jgi:molybdopterin-guanine dinucleotide biosynthesis protein A
MNAISDITGLILAGGRAQRMGGRAKGLLPLAGKTLIAHAIDRLAPQVAEVMISANGPEYDDLGLAVVRDLVADEASGRAGPLAGLHAGLLACESQWLVTVPCDAPFLPLDLVERMAAAKSASRQSRLFVAESPRGLEPGFMLCHVSLADDLGQWLQAGGRKAQAWLAEHAAPAVAFPDANCFANINTPEELAAWSG